MSGIFIATFGPTDMQQGSWPRISSMHYHNVEYMLTPNENGKYVCIFVGGNSNSDWLVSRGRGFHASNERWFTHSINQPTDGSTI